MFARLFSTIVRSAQQFGSRRIPYSFRNHASTLPQRSTETVSLPIGGNGFIDLEILHPQTSTKSNNNNILVHLPAGPKPPGTAQRPSIVNNIHDLAPHFQDTTLIDILYRLGPRPRESLPEEHDHRFPTPIHDVFTAWDYVTDSESPHNQLAAAVEKENEGITEPRICIYGSHIGGALALALALTNPNQILAVAVEEPLVDWVGLAELATYEGAMTRVTGNPLLKRARSANAKAKQQEEQERLVTATAAAARALVKLRTSLFRSPSGYFDSFASPVLFLRAPGRDTPTTQTAAPERDWLVGDDGDGMRLERNVMQENGVKKTGDLIRDQAFGPYDDDWHAATQMSKPAHANQKPAVSGNNAVLSDRSLRAQNGARETTEHQPVTDLSYWTPDGAGAGAGAGSERSSSPRRRKVLRRWPSITTSEEALLPYVNVFLNISHQASLTSTSLSDDSNNDALLGLDLSPVTHAQGVELLDLLKRACFWGREKSFAEERVVSTDLSTSTMGREVDGRDKLVQWLQSRFSDAGVDDSSVAES